MWVDATEFRWSKAAAAAWEIEEVRSEPETAPLS